MGQVRTLVFAIRSLGRNKVRTFLTLLGIVIGIATVIARVALRQGASSRVEKQISSMGRCLLVSLHGAAPSCALERRSRGEFT